MLKTKLSGLICYELSNHIENLFNIKTTVVEMGTHTELKPLMNLADSVEKDLKTFITGFEDGFKSVGPVLNEIQEHSQMITAKINQI